MSQTHRYLVNLIFDPEYHGYVADVPQLPGCMSQGKTVEGALRNVRSAIRAYLKASRPSAAGGRNQSNRLLLPIADCRLKNFVLRVNRSRQAGISRKSAMRPEEDSASCSESSVTLRLRPQTSLSG